MRSFMSDLHGVVGSSVRVSFGGEFGVSAAKATGRGLPAVREALRDPLLPRPRWIIADRGHCPRRCRPVPGRAAPNRAPRRLARYQAGARRDRHVPALTYQDDVAQDGRCSFYLHPDQLTAEITDAVSTLGCRWIYSAGRYFDVLPYGASKGSALVALAQQQGWSVDSMLVAGDSLNDLPLFTLGAHGVIVGNAEPALAAAVPAEDAVHRPTLPGAAGVLEALRNLGWIKSRYRLVIGYHCPPVSWTPERGWQNPRVPTASCPPSTACSPGTLGPTRRISGMPRSPPANSLKRRKAPWFPSMVPAEA